MYSLFLFIEKVRTLLWECTQIETESQNGSRQNARYPVSIQARESAWNAA